MLELKILTTNIITKGIIAKISKMNTLLHCAS